MHEQNRIPAPRRVRRGGSPAGYRLAGISYTREIFAHEAKISIDQARSIALNAHPAKITEEELEQKARGSGLRYSFAIKHNQVTQEVGVDAATGRVLENKAEGPNPD